MVKGLISVVSPCYNHGIVLYRFLDSLLEQTYTNMQVILVDDGSTDNTKDVVEAYIPKFKSKNIILEYYYQDNAGVSEAINTGLRYVKGEFLCWPDSDDWYSPTAMEERVNFLNNNPEYGIVTCDAYSYVGDENHRQGYLCSGKSPERFEENQFHLLLEGRTLICSLCHMVRTEAFFDTHPQRRIYPSRHGQNIQMLLPVYYKYKRAFLDKALCHYLILENSLSHSKKDMDKDFGYRNGIEELMVATLKSIPMSENERNGYIRYTNIKNSRRRLLLAKKYKQKEIGKKELILLKDLKGCKLSDYWTYLTI